MTQATTRNQLLNRWGMLKRERASWFSHWQEISRNLLPRQGRFFIEDRNRGERRHNSIYDSTGTRALRACNRKRKMTRLTTSISSISAFRKVPTDSSMSWERS